MEDSCKTKVEPDQENASDEDFGVVYKLRDFNKNMVKAWMDVFDANDENIQISFGDIFKGAPQADAIVSPANSFGYMDGGIDMVYTRHFDWQMQKRLQKVIREEYDGENLVGNAIIIPAYEEDKAPLQKDLEGCNEGQPIKFLISAPTMRIPLDVSNTPNAYLAFRGVILAVQKHNKNSKNIPIKSVLCPGLGTAVGMMPFQMCAQQMLNAYQLFELKLPEHRWKIYSDNLFQMDADHFAMVTIKDKRENPKGDESSSTNEKKETKLKK